MTLGATRELLERRIGAPAWIGEWVEITQSRIDAFAAATGDHQWIHTDVARAALESPWKCTIAHGFLTLSLLPLLRGAADGAGQAYPGIRAVINYGLNRLRFVTAVRVGARLRIACEVLSVEAVPGGLETVELCTVEIEGESRPACVAEWVLRLYP
jgi:acyl dehydratase